MKLDAGTTKTIVVFRSCTMHPQSPPLTIVGTVLKGSDDLNILGLNMIPRLLFRSIFGRFPNKLPNDSASSVVDILLGGHSMIYCFLGDAYVVLSCQFWSTLLFVVLAADKHIKLLDHDYNQW